MKAKKIIITALLAMLILGLKAQDKYEYAVISYILSSSSTKGTITISKEGKFSITDVKLSEGFITNNFLPVLEVVNKLSSEGWEVYSNNVLQNYNYFYLRKKKS